MKKVPCDTRNILNTNSWIYQHYCQDETCYVK